MSNLDVLIGRKFNIDEENITVQKKVGYKFLWCIGVMVLFGSCKYEKIKIVTIRDLIFLPEIHENRAIFMADSLLFIEQDSLAEAKYFQLLNKNNLSFQKREYIKAKLLYVLKDNVKSDTLYADLLSEDSSKKHLVTVLEITAYELKSRKKLSTIDQLKNMSKTAIPEYYNGKADYLLARYFEERKSDLDSAWYFITKARSAFENTKVITPAYQECIEKMTSLSTYKRKNLLAIRYANLLFEFDRYLPKADSVDIAKAYSNRAFMMFREGDIKGTIDDIELGLQYIKAEKHPEIYQQLLKSYLVIYMLQNQDSLWHYIANQINKNITHSGSDFIEMNRWYGQFYTYQNHYQKAIPFLRLALDTEIKKGFIHTAKYSTICFLLSQCFENLNDYDSALSYMAKNEGLESYNTKSMLVHISKDRGYSFVTGLRCANIYFSQYKHTGQLANLLQAKAYLDVLNAVMFGQFKVAEENAILQFYLESGQEYFHLGMDVYYDLWKKTGDQQHLEVFVNFSDKNKNSLMYRDIQMAQKQTALPPDIIQREFNLRAAIKEEKRKGLGGNNTFNTYMDEYVVLEQEMESKYQPFITNGLIKESLNIKQFQQNMADEETCILIIDETQYHWYYTLITRRGIILERAPIPQDKISGVDALLASLQKDQTQNRIKFDWLPKSIISSLSRKIMYIPDGVYHRFPLSALLDDKKYEVIYLPTLRVYKKFSEQDKTANGIALFAFSDTETIRSTYRTRLAELPGTYKEVSRLLNTYPKASIYTGKDATKSNFIKAYQDTNIQYIHLALHGLANSAEKDDVKLFFRTTSGGLDSLYGYELLRYKSKCKKMVLSACQSGIGAYINGEGSYSLPRYFMINGATDVVFNYWDVED